ncbi:hypothetical protein HK096_011502 [Nowakowskiella sp. JEL0078]|nr:hypothetical protein HK096_011502 [Nowakowskiella sp. JEL0078]
MSSVFHWPSGFLTPTENQIVKKDSATSLDTVNDLIADNHAWAKEVAENNPSLLANMAAGQHPKYLWFGCSDSRVPPTEIIPKLGPGDVFVHRNIANVINHTDLSLLSVLEYAVIHLKVEHIIVCGHYQCGGVAGALGNDQLGLIDHWLCGVKDTYQAHREELEKLDPAHKAERLVEWNVKRGVYNLANTSAVQNAWAKGRNLTISGFVFRFADGKLKDLDVSVSGVEQVPGIYVYKNESE